MRSVAIYAAVPAIFLGMSLYTVTAAMSRPGQIMTTRDMNIECRGNGFGWDEARASVAAVAVGF